MSDSLIANALYEQILTAEKKYKRACAQLVIINQKLLAQWTRFQRAQRDERQAFQTALRFQVICLEEVRMQYYEFAQKQYDTVDALRDAMQVLSDDEYYIFDDFINVHQSLDILEL